MTLDVQKLRDRIRVADGATATQLRARGYPQREVAEKANLDAPQLVAALVREYAEAGAQFVLTNTFSANQMMLERRGAALNVAEVNHAAVRIAVDTRAAILAERAASRATQRESGAAGNTAAANAGSANRRSGAATAIGGDELWIVGSIGPSGRILSVREATTEAAERNFAEQAAALIEGGVDAIALETFSELDEILAALRGVRSAGAIPIIAAMSFDSGPQRTQTMMGQDAAACAKALDEAGADLVGCNCGAGIAEALPAVVAVRNATERPIWVKPSVGLPELENGVPHYRITPEEFIEPVPTLLDAGVDIIGGCCGVGPDHIRKLAHLVASRARHAQRR